VSRLRPNNSFKPTPLRGIACVPALRLHAFAATARVGLTQVLELTMKIHRRTALLSALLIILLATYENQPSPAVSGSLYKTLQVKEAYAE